MGTVREGQTADEFAEDYAKAGKASYETGAKILEVNLSCPNIGNEGLVCYNIDMTERVCKAIRDVIGDVPLILKVGYYKDNSQVEELVRVAGKYAQAISAINTIQAEVHNPDGVQALPGKNRLRSGVCGRSITWAGLEMTKRLKEAQMGIGAKLAIVGVGGVCVPEDFKKYRDAGADVVMTATGAMWNPHLAKEIKQAYPDA
jgi:dihydroorotate dehydrogenase